ncbi:MATE family efflux transporter, partial [Faecalimonas sp.]
MKSIVLFSLPLIAGNLFQQLYNLVDTLIVGKYVGANALAAVGSSYMTMTFLTSIIIGLCMGSSVVFSYFYSAKDTEQLSQSFFQSFLFIFGITILINGISFWFVDEILQLLNIEESIFSMTKEYLLIIFAGMFFVFLYNYFAAVLRSMGNSFIPLVFLIIA